MRRPVCCSKALIALGSEPAGMLKVMGLAGCAYAVDANAKDVKIGLKKRAVERKRRALLARLILQCDFIVSPVSCTNPDHVTRQAITSQGLEDETNERG